FETRGGPSPMLQNSSRLSGGLAGGKSSVILGRPAEGAIGEDGEGAGGQRSHLRQRVRRDSMQLAAAGIAPATATQASQQGSAMSRAIGQGHARRQSHIMMSGVMGSVDLTGVAVAQPPRNGDDDDD